jgi:hypothetical protein
VSNPENMLDVIEFIDGGIAYDTFKLGGGSTVSRTVLENTDGEWLTVGLNKPGNGYTTNKSRAHTNLRAAEGISNSQLFHIDKLYVDLVVEDPNTGTTPNVGAGDVARIMGLLPVLQYTQDGASGWETVGPLAFIGNAAGLDRDDIGLNVRAGALVAAFELGEGATLEGAANPRFRLSCNDDSGIAVTLATAVHFRLTMTGSWGVARN